MKSFCLFELFILALFVISAKANTKDQVNDKKSISGGGYKIWLKEVNGYDKKDEKNGYAGVIGEAVTGLRIAGGKSAYRVHLKSQDKWLGKVNGNDQNDLKNGYAGTLNGDPIDAIVVGGGVEYAVHILGGDWLQPVNGYNLTDPNNGYAGIFGKAIDAVMIKGKTYATSYTNKTSTATNDKCTAHNGTCMNPTKCEGTILNGLCPGSNDNKCCVPKAGNETIINEIAKEGENDLESSSVTLKAFSVLATILSLSMIYFF